MTTTKNDGLAEAARWGGETPAGITDRDWHHMVADGACALAEAQGVPNDCTPEEYAAAAIRAALPSAFRIAYATNSPPTKRPPAADLPSTNDEILAWLARHGLSTTPGVGVVLSAARRDILGICSACGPRIAERGGPNAI